MRNIFQQRSFAEHIIEKYERKKELFVRNVPAIKMYWDKYNEAWICKKCGHKTTLRSGTVMQHSKMPFKIWFFVEHLLTSTKHSFSVLEIQSQLGYKRYQTIWEMVHKLRDVMGQNNAKTLLKGGVELDEAYITTDREESKSMGEKCKRGLGSERKSKVAVLIESEEVVEKVDERVTKPRDASKFLPWVYIAVPNLKSRLRDLYHGVKEEFLQYYLDEFCYKFNRRYKKEKLFELLMETTISCRTKFRHRIYNKNLSPKCG